MPSILKPLHQVYGKMLNYIKQNVYLPRWHHYGCSFGWGVFGSVTGMKGGGGEKGPYLPMKNFLPLTCYGICEVEGAHCRGRGGASVVTWAAAKGCPLVPDPTLGEVVFSQVSVEGRVIHSDVHGILNCSGAPYASLSINYGEAFKIHFVLWTDCVDGCVKVPWGVPWICHQMFYWIALCIVQTVHMLAF